MLGASLTKMNKAFCSADGNSQAHSRDSQTNRKFQCGIVAEPGAAGGQEKRPAGVPQCGGMPRISQSPFPPTFCRCLLWLSGAKK